MEWNLMEQIISYLSRGGIVMIPLLLCSVIGVAIIIEKSFVLRKRKILIPEIISVVESIETQKDIELANRVCRKHSGPFANILLVALNLQEYPKEEIKELTEEQGRQEVRSLEKGLSVMETIASISPLLGLLGTVIGMIKVFTVISTQGAGQARALSGGISEALITTATGLVIGIPILVAYNYFTNRAENFILDIEKYSTRLVQKIKRIQE
ncbi:MotA/TolQ/ExbB proton channel family protein [candidate division KSB1 bacterium]|nr:MotA/TolQ/ExbB proton channel family protein [candidate division KSB1 bacterium]